MAIATRKAARAKIAQLLEAELVTALGIVQAVYPYQVGDFQGQSPVIVVASGGTRRVPLTVQGLRPQYRFSVYVFVLYNSEDGTWTEEDAEDALDDIEEKVSEVINSNNGLDNFWVSIEVPSADFTVTDSIVIGGSEYRREIIEVIAG